MEPVFEIKRGKKFDLEEAKKVSRLLFKITRKKSLKVDALAAQLEALSDPRGSRAMALQNQLEQEIMEWEGKVERLGGVPRGVWAADLDSGDGYYCWKYPEMEVDHWHGYLEGNSNRVSISGAAVVPAEKESNLLLNLQEMK